MYIRAYEAWPQPCTKKRETALKEAKTMNILTNRIALLAAGAVVLGSMAYGQTTSVKAEIPFAFRTSAGTLPAGVYTIRSERATGPFSVTSLGSDALKEKVFVTRLSQDYNPNNTKAAVIFHCGDAGCALDSIRSGDGMTSYYPNLHSRRDKEVAIAATGSRYVKSE
jgi:hypothetical protein